MKSQRSILQFFGKPKTNSIESKLIPIEQQDIVIISKPLVKPKPLPSVLSEPPKDAWWLPKGSTEQIEIFTDGSCLHNGKKNAKASWAVIVPAKPEYDTGARLEGKLQTNNRAELTAIIEAFGLADKIDPVNTMSLKVFTDSELAINSLTKWLNGWKRNGWKTKDRQDVSNKDLLESLDLLMRKRKVIFQHVKAHTGKQDYMSINNEKADLLAKQCLDL